MSAVKPTVDDLVKIFRENDWQPKRVSGANIVNVRNGLCCAIPAVVKFIDPSIDFNKIDEDFDLYEFINKTYGKNKAEELYSGFDDNVFYQNSEFYKLGKELYEKLSVS